MRRLRIFGIVCGVVMLALTGCSGGDGPSGDAATRSAGRTAPATPNPDASSSAGPSAERSMGTDAGSSETDSPGPSDEDSESSGPTEDGRQEAVLAGVEGDTSGKCVAVGERRDVRSGSIMGGPFDTARSSWGKKRQGTPKDSVRLYWVPLHAKKMPGVEVLATQTSSGTKVKVSQDSFGDADQWKYYDTNVALPEAGTWQLKVSSGPDKGCFEFTLPR